MASQPITDQFAYVLTPSDRPPPSARVSSTHAAGTDGGCSVCGIRGAFDARMGQIALTLPDGPVPAVVDATVVATSGGETHRYQVSRDAVRSLLVTGRVEWYLPPGSPPPTQLAVSFGSEGADGAEGATHELTIL